MTEIFSILGLSFLLGMRHATDADHVVAVTTMITRQKKGILASALIGILWGIGHSLTVTLVGIPIILYSLVIPVKIGFLLEFMVGLMLLFLGILNLTGLASKIIQRFTRLEVHNHNHLHDGSNHAHTHIHAGNIISQSIHHLGLFQTIRPLVIGLVHGLAGSAAVALLVLSTIHNTKTAIFYLFVFHFGVVSGMMIITVLIGISIVIAKKRSDNIGNFLTTASGFLSLILGLFIMYQIGFQDGFLLKSQ